MQYWTRGPVPLAAMFAMLALAAGCSGTTSSLGRSFDSAKAMVMPARSHGYRATERERQCLARAIFFEANRSSRDGMIAVGSVVMNRRDSGKWGENICDVVGAKRQFAPGVLSRPMNSKSLPDVMEATDAVLKGERHPKVHKDVMFFHTAGLKFPYKNMHYTTVAGGNAFYFKKSRKQDRLPVQPTLDLPEVMVAEAAPVRPEAAPAAIALGDQVPEAQPVQAAFAKDTVAAQVKPRGIFGRMKARPEQVPAGGMADKVEIALADEAPVPRQRAVALQSDEQFDVSGAAALSTADEPIEPTQRQLRKKQRAKAATQTMTADVAYDAPAAERFGAETIEPAYAGTVETGLSFGDGAGTGILGRMVVDGGWQ